jgi:hypothetical protein
MASEFSWTQFFTDAGIPTAQVEEYTTLFEVNR